MKKLLKIVGITLLCIVLILYAIFLIINFRGIPVYETQAVNHTVISTPKSVQRGKKLATMLCAGCHMSSETGKLTGKLMLDGPPEFGEIYSLNITQDKTYGIGNWTDGELIYLLRTGIRKNGAYAPPYMAKLPNMADEDVDAIVSFLRSDDPIVSADPTPDQESKPSFLTKFLCTVAFKPFPMPDQVIAMPDTTNKVELGKYLALNLDCFSCHSADFKTVDYLMPENSKGYFGGGNKLLNMKGDVMITPNLTPDNETGIGAWTEGQFVKAVRFGIVDGQEALRYPMMPYTQLTQKEAAAIFTYLQSIPPISNKVERSIIEQ